MTEPTRAIVITVSDRSARGERKDASGPAAQSRLAEAGYDVGEVRVVPDGQASVTGALRAAIADGARIVITSGGTGVSPRDETPEGTEPVLGKHLLGVAEALRRHGAEFTPYATLSRGLVGVDATGRAVIANLPGSTKAVDQGLDVLLPLFDHLVGQLDGQDH